MSFISVVGTSLFVTIMSDGQVTGENGNPVFDKLQKYIFLSDKVVVGTTGKTELASKLANQMKSLFSIYGNDLSTLRDIAEKDINSRGYSPNSEWLLNAVIAGVDQNGQTFIGSLNNHGKENIIATPKGNDINTIFLEPDGLSINTAQAFRDIYERHLKLSSNVNPAFILNCQKELNDLVADDNGTVNKEIFSSIITAI